MKNVKLEKRLLKNVPCLINSLVSKTQRMLQFKIDYLMITTIIRHKKHTYQLSSRLSV